jgi:hypothetical protein
VKYKLVYTRRSERDIEKLEPTTKNKGSGLEMLDLMKRI